MKQIARAYSIFALCGKFRQDPSALVFCLPMLATDLYGRLPGAAYENALGGAIPILGSTFGWDNQVGLGQRDSNPSSSPWFPSGNFVMRPDLKLSVARHIDEKAPRLNFSAEADVEL